MQDDENISFNTNSFYYYADKYIKEATSESETGNINRTRLFWNELQAHINNNELINITINGQVRLGKSTAGFAIGQKILEMLNKKQGTHKQFNMDNIARDQQEYSKMMRNPKLTQTMIS